MQTIAPEATLFFRHRRSISLFLSRLLARRERHWHYTFASEWRTVNGKYLARLGISKFYYDTQYIRSRNTLLPQYISSLFLRRIYARLNYSPKRWQDPSIVLCALLYACDVSRPSRRIYSGRNNPLVHRWSKLFPNSGVPTTFGYRFHLTPTKIPPTALSCSPDRCARNGFPRNETETIPVGDSSAAALPPFVTSSRCSILQERACYIPAKLHTREDSSIRAVNIKISRIDAWRKNRSKGTIERGLFARVLPRG